MISNNNILLGIGLICFVIGIFLFIFFKSGGIVGFITGLLLGLATVLNVYGIICIKKKAFPKKGLNN